MNVCLKDISKENSLFIGNVKIINVSLNVLSNVAPQKVQFNLYTRALRTLRYLGYSGILGT